jgi:hypothetical protein
MTVATDAAARRKMASFLKGVVALGTVGPKNKLIARTINGSKPFAKK